MTRRNGKQGKTRAAITKRDTHNKNELDARQRQAQAKRREKVAALYHAGYKQEEIADRLKMAQSTVSQDLAYLREKWTQAATAIIGDWIGRELAYAVEQRDAVLRQWRIDGNPRNAQVVLAWSKRIADLLGLDAPDKVEDWTAKDWREYAQAAPSVCLAAPAATAPPPPALTSTLPLAVVPLCKKPTNIGIACFPPNRSQKRPDCPRRTMP